MWLTGLPLLLTLPLLRFDLATTVKARVAAVALGAAVTVGLVATVAVQALFGDALAFLAIHGGRGRD